MMASVSHRFNLWPAVWLVLVLFLFFWGPPLYRVASLNQDFERLPSSFDHRAGIPVPQQISEALTPRLLVEVYQDTCTGCRAVAPVLARLLATKPAKACFTPIKIDATKPENQLFVELFQVKEVPALFVFQPTAMKKQAIKLDVQDLKNPQKVEQAIQVALKAHSSPPLACDAFLKANVAR
jgi:thiol-disulfide isomerase/thioredoxin